MAQSDRIRTDELSRALAAERERAEKFLWGEMAKLGLRREDGWTITEFTREDKGGTQLVLRPMHLRLKAPEGLECVVGIVEDGGDIEANCSSPAGDRPVG
jgi:hypothetical protein